MSEHRARSAVHGSKVVRRKDPAARDPNSVLPIRLRPALDRSSPINLGEAVARCPGSFSRCRREFFPGGGTIDEGSALANSHRRVSVAHWAEPDADANAALQAAFSSEREREDPTHPASRIRLGIF